MTARQIYDFAVGQVAWHEKQIVWCNGQIAWCNKELKRTRKEDKELKAYAYETRPDDPYTEKIFGGDYIGTETRKLINERARYYRENKYHAKRIAYYKKQAEDMERYIG